MITGITVSVDRTSYSRYGDDFPIVTITGKAAGAVGGEQVVITLSRTVLSGQYQLFITTVIVPAGGAFTDTIDLRTVKDTNGFSSASISKEFNDYTVTASDATDPLTFATTNFSVLPFTVDQVKARWCAGLPLITYEKLQAVNQPVQVTGVTLGQPSFGSIVGPYQLQFSASPTPSISWTSGALLGGLAMPGTQVPIPASGTYILPDVIGRGAIPATVNFAQLPTTAASDTIYVGFGTITDEAIIREIISMTAQIQEFMNILFEPTYITTQNMLELEPLIPTVVEKIGMAINFYKPDNWLKWLEFKCPYMPLLKFFQLSGYFNKTKAIDIDEEHLISFDERSAEVQFVPSNLAVVNSFFIGPGVYIMFFNQIYVPQFWNYYVVCGYRNLPAAIADYIAKRVAIDLLNIAGQARYPAGMAGQSTSRDGISESTSILAGVYKTYIDQYEQDLGRTPDGQDQMMKSLRNRFRGLAFTTL